MFIARRIRVCVAQLGAVAGQVGLRLAHHRFIPRRRPLGLPQCFPVGALVDFKQQVARFHIAAFDEVDLRQRPRHQ
ncbi:MAG: hypothetical protein QM757_30615 [Paludibaculum sp.]